MRNKTHNIAFDLIGLKNAQLNKRIFVMPNENYNDVIF